MNESVVYLQRSADGEIVEATLCDEITSEHLDEWNKTWVPQMAAFCKNKPPADKPEDSHWDWKGKAAAYSGLLSYQSFALIAEGKLQGLMMTNNVTSGRIPEQFGKPLIYVEFVATAPWNRPEMQKPPEFRGAGRVFLLAAIETSIDAGFKGRLGLHSLPQAEEFYETKCGMTRLGADSSHQDLIYYEMTETQADSFRRNHGEP